jgi:hypothetical protein
MDQSLFRAQVFVRELWSGFTMGARELNDGVTDEKSNYNYSNKKNLNRVLSTNNIYKKIIRKF